MDMTDAPEEGQLVAVDPTMLATLDKGEIEMKVELAHRYPRSIKQFRTDVFNMVTLSESVAAECIYALKRDDKIIEGPSARFAEVVMSAWGNVVAGARVISDQGEFITARGFFFDLQKNVTLGYDVQRRITDRKGRRYSLDMIGVTGNAASSIALRNAVFKGVPKAYWSDLYQGARQTAMGDVKTLPTRRAEVLQALARYGVTEQQACAKLRLKGKEDLGLEELLTLRGFLTTIKDGEMSPEEMFAPDEGDRPAVSMPQRKSAQPAAEASALDAQQAAAAPPIPAPAADGECISPAQAKWLVTKFGAMEMPAEAIAATLRRHGGTSIHTLTPEQFDGVRVELLTAGL